MITPTGAGIGGRAGAQVLGAPAMTVQKVGAGAGKKRLA
jgi:uncharacterized protein (DUF111 family)